MDLHYLKLTFLLLFLEENSCTSSKKTYYHCTYHKELFLKLLDKRDSEEMICWGSQLQDSTRILLTQKYNDYRREVAKGTCSSCYIHEKYQSMYEMKWHWILEKKAQELLEERNFSKRTAALSVNEILSSHRGELGERFLQTKSVEYSTISFLIDSTDQRACIEKFSNYLEYREMNILGDWTEHFRRQLVTFFGCSIAMIKVIQGSVGYTALDEKIETGDQVLLMVCVFASPIENQFTDLVQNEMNYYNTTFCNLSQTEVHRSNDLCSFADPTNITTLFTPCQVYYPHSYFLDMLHCPGDIPYDWRHYQLPNELGYDHLVVHLPNGAELKFDTSSGATFTKPAYDADLHHPLQELQTKVTKLTNLTLSDELDLDYTNVKLDASTNLLISDEWSAKKRAVKKFNTSSPDEIDLFKPSEFITEPLPGKPENQTIHLVPIHVVDPFDAKYCVVVTLFYFIVFFTLCLLLSIIGKYYVEKEYLSSL